MLFETRAAHYMPCALHEIITAEVSGHIQTWISRIFCKITVFPGILYLHYRSAYGHQTWQGGDLQWESPINKVAWIMDNVVSWHYVTIWEHYISTTRVSMATKLGRMVNYLDLLLPIKPNYPLITWFFNIMWQTKTIISLPQCLQPPSYKVIERFDLLVLQGHVTNENHYIFTTRVSVATKLGMIVT